MGKIIQLREHEYYELFEKANRVLLEKEEIQKRALELYKSKSFCDISLKINDREYADILKITGVCSIEKEYDNSNVFIKRMCFDKQILEEECEQIINNLLDRKYKHLLDAIKKYKLFEKNRFELSQVLFFVLFGTGWLGLIAMIIFNLIKG